MNCLASARRVHEFIHLTIDGAIVTVDFNRNRDCHASSASQQEVNACKKKFKITLSGSYNILYNLNRGVLGPGTVACDAEFRKKLKYASLSATTYNFIPIAVETIGALGDEASAFFKDLT